LQQLQLIIRDAGLRQQTEAGVDAIGSCATRDDAIDQLARPRDALAIRIAQRKMRRACVDLAQLRQG
jgi:hypothetical protein